jgi:hypothetical protein
MRKIWYGFTTGLGFWASLGVMWVIGTLALKFLPIVNDIVL